MEDPSSGEDSNEKLGEDPNRLELEKLIATPRPAAAESIVTMRIDELSGDNENHNSNKVSEASTETAESKLSQDTKRFTLKSEHAVGGLGVVFQAEDRQLDRIVALKQIRSEFADEPAYRDKFLREALVTGKLEHPSIVPVYALGTDEHGRPYYAMRFIKGQTLKERIESFHEGLKSNQYPFDSMVLRKLLRRFIDVCQALDYAHSRGVIHRDIKPSNIMLGKFGETLVVDWGLARQFDAHSKPAQAVRRNVSLQSEIPLATSDTPSDALTRMGSFVGSVPYASPEQLRGDLDSLGPGSDIYSLGAVLFEILVGKTAVENISSEKELADEILLGNLSSPRKVQPLVPKALDGICRKAMAGRISERYQTADDLRLEIEAFLDDEKVTAWNDGIFDRLRRTLRKRPALFSAVSVSAVAALGFFGFVAWYKTLDNVALESALAERDAAIEQEQLARANAEEQESIAETNAREASEQRAFARETVFKLVREVNNGQEKGLGIQAVRQNLFLELIRQFELLTAGKADDPSSKLALLRAKVGLVKSVASLGRWQADQFATLQVTKSLTSQQDPNTTLARQATGNSPGKRIEAFTDPSTVSLPDISYGDAKPIMENTAAAIEHELSQANSTKIDLVIELLHLYLENATACREIDLLELAGKQTSEIINRCDSLLATVSETSSPSAGELISIQLQSLRQLGLIEIQQQRDRAGIERLRKVQAACRDANLAKSPTNQLLLAEVLNDLADARPAEESFSEWYSMLGDANAIAAAILDENLIERANKLRYNALMKMSFMMELSQPTEAEKLRKEARELYGETLDQQQDRMVLNDLRGRAWNMIHQADAWSDNPERKSEVNDLYERAFSQLEKIYDARPESREAKRDLATAYERRGITLLTEFEKKQSEFSDIKAARYQFERMLELKQELANDKSDWLAQVELAITFSHFSDLELAMKNSAEAIVWTSKQVSLLEPALKSFPEESQVRRYLMLAYWELSRIHQQNHQFLVAKQYCSRALELAGELDMGMSRIPYVERTKQNLKNNLLQLEGYASALLPIQQLLNLPHSRTTTSVRRTAAIERLSQLAEKEDWMELSQTLAALDTEFNQDWVNATSLVAGYADLVELAKKNLADEPTDQRDRLLDRITQSQLRAKEICEESIRVGTLTLQQLRQSDDLEKYRLSDDWKQINRPDAELRQLLSEVLPYTTQLRIVTNDSLLTIRKNGPLPESVFTCERIDFDGNSPVPDEILERLNQVRGLKQLMIEGAPWLRNEQLRSVAKCSGVRVIGLGGNPQIDATGLSHLSEMKTLNVLFLGRTRVNLAMAEALSKLPNVELLDLNGCGVDGRSLPFVAKMNSLRDLVLTNNAIDDDGIQHIVSLPLHTLRLTETDITDKALPQLSQMKTLEVLSLSETKITDAAIESILKLPNLSILQIDRNPIGAEAIAALAKLGRLNQIYVEGCPISSDQLLWLKNRMPFCDINVTPTYRERGSHGRPSIAEEN